jgi:hypothetical protein
MKKLMMGMALIGAVVSYDASAVEVNSAIAGQDIEWSQFGISSVTSGTTFTYTGGTGSVYSTAGTLQATLQGTAWYGNMPANEPVLWTGSGAGPEITLNFDSGIFGAGAYIQSFFYGSFTAMIQAYDFSGNILESYTENGFSGSNTGTAIYLGVARNNADIFKISYTLTSAPAGALNDFAISNVNVAQTGISAVPEADTYALMMFGLALVSLISRRKQH